MTEAQRWQLMSALMPPACLAAIITRIADGTISRAGALVLSRIMLATGASEFVASESDILDGMAWSLV